MLRRLAAPWLEQTLELCERVLHKAAHEHPSNPVLAKVVVGEDPGGKVVGGKQKPAARRIRGPKRTSSKMRSNTK